jgi:hypothetical protein
MADSVPVKNGLDEYPMADTIRNLSYSFEQSIKDENEEPKLELTVDDEEESLKQEMENNYAKIYQNFLD